MDKVSNYISISYAILLFVGGLIGFLKAHSKPSLITGALSCLIVLVAWQLGSKKPKAGYLFIASTSLMLSMFFLIRFAETQAFMPGGLMLILSTITFAIAGRGYIVYRPEIIDEKEESGFADEEDPNQQKEQVSTKNA